MSDNYYPKFKAKVQYQTKSGMKGTIDATNPLGLLDEAIGYVFNEHGEEHTRLLFEKTMERRIQGQKAFEEQQRLAKEKQSG